jgi:heme exporter protein B
MSAAGSARAWSVLLRRDLLLAARRSGDWINPLLFFLIVVSLFPLSVGPVPELLARIGPGVILVAALLATLLSLDGLFRSDFQDGSLEQLLVSPHPLGVLVTAKVVAHWLGTGLPLVLLSPLLAVMMQLPVAALPVVMLSLALTTPTLSLLGAIGVALTVGLPRGGLLLALLVLPLYVPVLIFAARVMELGVAGLPVLGTLYLLGAILVIAATLAPFAIATALRISLS